ncbi:MAG: hypothetical protein GC182_20825 [Rhodopseudomonas sp.]|nr:hypothetical protein [Rhodopseudomonas sp.]
MTHAAQLGFDLLLASADEENELRQHERQCAHLPGTMPEAVPFFRALIDRHHAAMLEGDVDAVSELRDEARLLAVKLNRYEAGILADDDAPGRVLDRLTRAAPGAVLLWGQSGQFEITLDGMRVAIDMDGMFGIGASHMAWLGFSAHAVDFHRPFISDTGYRSFLGCGGALLPGYTPESFASEIIAAHIRHGLKGRLIPIKPEYGG